MTTLAVLVLEPVALVATSFTVEDPAAKVWDGFCEVLVPPSPKSQAQLVGEPVEVSVNWTVSGAVPEVLSSVKEAVGALPAAVAVMTTLAVLVLEPVALVATSFTVEDPAAKVWDGFCEVLVPPSPKSQAQLVGEPVEVSVNWTVSGAVPEVLSSVKEAVGALPAAVAVMTTLAVLVLEPVALVATSFTVEDPAAKVWDGFCEVLVPPSPKSQAQLVGEPVEVSVNWTVSGAVPEVLSSVKEAVGALPAAVAVMTTLAVLVLEPVALVATSFTVEDPAAKVWDGFCEVLVPPSPKSQAQLVGEPVEVSVNWTVSGAVPEVLSSVNDAVGAVPVPPLPAGFSARTQAAPLTELLWVKVLVPVAPAVGRAL